jgi:hypothetical protein
MIPWPFLLKMALNNIITLCNASKSLTRTEKLQASKLAEVGKFTLEQATSRTISSALDTQPILQSCQADGTPIKVVKPTAPPSKWIVTYLCHSKLSEPLDIFLGKTLPDAAEGGAKTTGDRAKQQSGATALLKGRASRSKLVPGRAGGSSVDGCESVSSNDEVIDIDEATAEAEWNSLNAVRAELASSKELTFDDFRVIVRGAHGGQANCHTGLASSAEVERWCRLRFVPFSGRYGIDKFRGHSYVMAAAWCHKMQHFKNLTLPDEPVRAFTAVELAAYEPTTAFLAAKAELLTLPGCSVRVMGLENLFA